MPPRVDICMLPNFSPFSSSESSRPADVPAGNRDMAREELVRHMKAQRDQRQALLDAHDLPAADVADAFGRVARLAQQTFNVPVVLLTFLGAEWQWFNAALGTDLDSVPLHDSFCIYTVQDETLLVVEDATQDERFADIPVVDGDLRVRFYAGAPLETPGGARIGTLCMFDVESRSLDADERQALRDLAQLATDEIALRKSLAEHRSTEQRLQSILQTSVAAIMVLRRDGRIQYMNGRTRDLLGGFFASAPDDEVHGMNFGDLDIAIADEAGEPLSPDRMALHQVIETGKPRLKQRRVLTQADGRQVTVEISAAPLVDREGSVQEVVYSIDEIDDRHYGEQLHHHQLRTLERIAHGAALPDALSAVIDMVETLRPGAIGSVLLLDDQRLRHGSAPNLPTVFVDAIDGSRIGPEAGSCGTAAFTGTEVTSPDIQTDPRWKKYRHLADPHDLRACWSIPIRGDEGKILGTLALYWTTPHTPDERDEKLGRTAARLAGIAIEQDQYERELRESEAHFQQLAENIDEVFWLRTEEEMLYLSPAYEHIWGREFQSVSTASDGHLGLVHPSDVERIREAYRRSWGTAGPPTRFDEEYRIIRPDGAIRWIQAVGWSFRISGSRETRQAGYAVDVTERVRRRHELIAAKQEAEELNRFKTAFLANMSHEIRTPLTSIIGFAEILEEELGPDHGRAPELIHTAGRRLMTTLDSVLQLSRLEANVIQLHPVEIQLCDDVRDTMSLFEQQAERKGIDLQLDVPARPVEICVDPSALQRILQNLIGNAVKFTETGHVRVGVAEAGKTVRLEVEDTGVGIGPNFVEKAFDAFEQESTGPGRSFEGSGLGLTVVKRLVTLMGGTVEVDSVEGEGTTFTVHLPADGRTNLDADAAHADQ